MKNLFAINDDRTVISFCRLVSGVDDPIVATVKSRAIIALDCKRMSLAYNLFPASSKPRMHHRCTTGCGTIDKLLSRKRPISRLLSNVQLIDRTSNVTARVAAALIDANSKMPYERLFS